jgi:hypothetical protein
MKVMVLEYRNLHLIAESFLAVAKRKKKENIIFLFFNIFPRKWRFLKVPHPAPLCCSHAQEIYVEL